MKTLFAKVCVESSQPTMHGETFRCQQQYKAISILRAKWGRGGSCGGQRTYIPRSLFLLILLGSSVCHLLAKSTQKVEGKEAQLIQSLEISLLGAPWRVQKAGDLPLKVYFLFMYQSGQDRPKSILFILFLQMKVYGESVNNLDKEFKYSPSACNPRTLNDYHKKRKHLRQYVVLS